MFPRNIHLLVSVSERKSPSGELILGLCSNFLKLMSSGQRCFVFVKESMFRIPLVPKDHPTPNVIMIGPGSGLAPMRALLQDRRWHWEQSNKGKKKKADESGKTILFFGCKNRQMDYLYQ